MIASWFVTQLILSLMLKICEVVSFLGSVTIIVRRGGSLLSEAIVGLCCVFAAIVDCAPPILSLV